MAGTIYYGVSDTAETTPEKIVKLNGLSRAIDESTLRTGDTLVVLFTHKNLASNPSIVLQNGDAEQEIGFTGDSGIAIKINDSVSDLSGAWGDGETVSFTYTELQSGIVYWYLSSIRATGDVYGVVKLKNDIDPDLNSDDAALTYNAVKRLIANETKKLHLFYQNNIGDTGILLGTLGIQDDNDQDIDGSPIKIYTTSNLGNENYPTTVLGTSVILDPSTSQGRVVTKGRSMLELYYEIDPTTDRAIDNQNDDSRLYNALLDLGWATGSDSVII